MKNFLDTKVVLTLFLFGTIGTLYCQSEQRNFENLLNEYSLNCNNLETASAKYNENLETNELVNAFVKFEEIKQSLLELNRDTNSDSIKNSTAYFGILCQIKQAKIQFSYIYDSDKAYQMLKEIDVFFNGEKPISFPFSYEYFGKIYTVNNYDIVILKSEYFLLMGNVCNSLKKENEMKLYYTNLLTLDKSKLELLPAAFKKEYLRNETKKIAEQRRANSTSNFYVGTYPFLLIKDADKRSYGVVLNYINRKSGVEFSFLQVNQKKDYTKDNLWKSTVDPLKEMSLWDGYYLHTQYKQFAKSYGASNYYQGFLLGMAAKKYNSMQVDIIENSTNSHSTSTFNPTAKQYIAMYNFGMMFLFKGYGLDAYCGVGGAYNRFEQGIAIDKTQYTIQNSSLQGSKPTSFGLMLRIGLTIGINIGKGNMR